jgi:hypothetical protein
MRKKPNNLSVGRKLNFNSSLHLRENANPKPKANNYIFDNKLNKYVEKSGHEENKHSPIKKRKYRS